MPKAPLILASAAAAAVLAVAAPALAAGTATATATVTGPDGSTVTTVHDGDGETERVIILTDRHRGAHPDGAAGGERHKLRIYSMGGADGADCTDHPLVDNASPDGRQRTRIMVCGHRELSAADRSTQLEHVLERIQHMDGLSDANKERVTAALREAIDQLRNAH